MKPLPSLPRYCPYCEVGFEADKKFCGLCGRPTALAAGTDFSSRCSILGDVFVNRSDDENFADLREYNDLGLPLAYAAAAEIIDITEDGRAASFINETWELLLAGLGIDFDEGYESLEELLGLED